MEESLTLLENTENQILSTEKHTVSSIQDRYLTFELDQEIYGVEILLVKEIIGLQKIIKIPQTPEYVKGIMNLRGQIIPVINLRKKLAMAEIEPEMDTAIIIVMIGSANVGFIVDRVIEVSTIDKNNLSDSPDFGAKIHADFIKHMAQKEKDVIMILNMENIFAGNEIHELHKLSNSEHTGMGDNG